MNAIMKAAEINDEDILSSTMESLIDIARVNYDYIEEYITTIGSITMAMINSPFDKPPKLAIEIWSSFAEVEIKRNE